MLLQGFLVCVALSFNAWQSHALKDRAIDQCPVGTDFPSSRKVGVQTNQRAAKKDGVRDSGSHGAGFMV